MNYLATCPHGSYICVCDTELKTEIIIFVFRDFNQLIESEVTKNCQLAFGVAEKELIHLFFCDTELKIDICFQRV